MYGNLACEAGNEVRARQLHEEALGVAEELFHIAARTSEPSASCLAPVLFGSSCNSVIELSRVRGDAQSVGFYLFRTVEQLLRVTESEQAGAELRSRCLQHLKVASVALFRYFDQHGMWDAASAYTERTNAAMLAIERLEGAAPAREALSPTGT